MNILDQIKNLFVPAAGEQQQKRIDQIVNAINQQLLTFIKSSENDFFEIEIRLSNNAYKLLESVLDLDKQIAKRLMSTASSTQITTDEFSIAIFLDPKVRSDMKIIVYQGFREESTANFHLEAPKKEYGSASLLTTTKKTYKLFTDLTTIGRNPENDISIDDPFISRNHGQFRLINNHYYYFDLKSTSGSMINNEIITQKLLLQGDVLVLGKTTLIFVLDDPTLGGFETAPIRVPIG